MEIWIIVLLILSFVVNLITLVLLWLVGSLVVQVLDALRSNKPAPEKRTVDKPWYNYPI